MDIQNVERRYGSVHALRGVDLRLSPGTIGLVGNNGAGKSTLLKILLGLLRPDSGSGTILAEDIMSSGRNLRGRIGYMSESAATVPMLRGVEFVTLSGDLYGMPHRDARRRAHEVLNYVGLGELRYRRLEEYSTGNVQRLKLAAALVHDPELLLLDEPTNGLDPAGRAGMLRLIEDLIAETGKSVILCTHLLGDVERLCQQVVMLDRGRVVHQGTIRELRHSIRSRYALNWQSRNGHATSEHTDSEHTGNVHGDAGDAAARFLEALRNGGVETHGTTNWADQVVSVPADWRSARFFELAAEHGLVLTGLVPEEEDLERAFLRVTTEKAESETQAAAAGEGDRGN
ncbi:MAG: ABC transporter ATP-binding protein [Planctomycetales bacterium]|nr:ABC transporter ATP-binding protein [Planctomycetales bacterium]